MRRRYLLGEATGSAQPTHIERLGTQAQVVRVEVPGRTNVGDRQVRNDVGNSHRPILAHRRAGRMGTCAVPAHVTFLLTEVVDSVRRWEEDELGMARATERLDAVVQALVLEHGGKLVKPRGEGDSHFLTFDAPVDAVACAVALQRAVSEEPMLPLRSASHVGAAELREGDWYGTTVNRCARIRAAAHGRQSLVSAEVATAVAGELSGGVSLRSLGRHRLKDLDEPTEIFQLCAEGLVAEHPPLPTLTQSHGLALPRSSFVGREAERDRVLSLLNDAAVVRIVGTPGVGVTRFAMETAARWWETHGRTLVLIDDADAPATTIGPALVTSHVSMAHAGAAVVRLEPLDDLDAELLLKQRVADDVQIPAGLVRHCDGLPLAIELLARRASSVDASVLAERLAADPLSVLGGDRRADPARHASVRAAFRAAFDAGWRPDDAPSPLVAAFTREVGL